MAGPRLPAAPGGYVCLRISVADTLSVALALLAIALALRSRWRTAILAGVLAVLAKEVAVLLFLGYACGAATAAAPRWWRPARGGAAWWAGCTCCCPTAGDRSTRSSAPFTGLARAADLARG